jgi:hypothetical protein
MRFTKVKSGMIHVRVGDEILDRGRLWALERKVPFQQVITEILDEHLPHSKIVTTDTPVQRRTKAAG